MPALNPTIRGRRLGIELRKLREVAGLTIEQVAARLEVSSSKISRIETAQVRPTPRDVRDLLEIYGAPDDLRDALLQIARHARRRGWWEAYGDLPAAPIASVETSADSIRSYSQALVPGLLQTADYARAVLRAIRADLTPSEIGRNVELRMTRQQLLTRDDPLRLWAVLDEAVVRRAVGGPRLLRRQIAHLAEMEALDNITIQILPFRMGAHAAMDGPFAIIGFPEPAENDIVFLENLTSELYIENADEVARYISTFERVRAAALTPDESRARLGRGAGSAAAI